MIEGTKEYVKLNNGVQIPLVGLGTWSPEGWEDRNLIGPNVEYAILKEGYRHIDTAYLYENEVEIGKALNKIFDDSANDIKREDIFVTTKIWPTFHDQIEHGFLRSLNNLNIGYIDMILIHYPVPLHCEDRETGMPWYPLDSEGKIRNALGEGSTHLTVWAQMEELLEKYPTKLKTIGVSNYSAHYIDELVENCKVKPAVNQIEVHPQLPSDKLVKHCKGLDIQVTAFSPYGGNETNGGAPTLKLPVIKELAEKYECSPGNVVLSYLTSRGIIVIPKSSKPSRIAENKYLVKLDEEDISRIGKISEDYGLLRTDKFEWGMEMYFEDYKASGIW